MDGTMRSMYETPHKRPVHATRWRNLRRYLAERKLKVTEAARLLDKSQGHVSHFAGKQPSKIIGDEMAADIETAFALPTGWLDVEGGSPEPFSFAPELSPSNDLRQSYVPRLDMDILAEAVRVITTEEAHNGAYSFSRHAELLMELYDKLLSGEDSMALAIQLTQQRSQPGVTSGNEPPGAASKR